MNYHKIEKTSIANGEGIRVVLWISGCSLQCRGCHNPETWNINSGKPFDENAKNELFEALDKPYIQGITFSGGHPLEDENLLDVYNLLAEIRKRFPEKDVWLYTGYKLEHILNPDTNSDYRKRIVDMCDVVVDGRYIESLRDITLRFRGSSNQNVWERRDNVWAKKQV